MFAMFKLDLFETMKFAIASKLLLLSFIVKGRNYNDAMGMWCIFFAIG